MPAWIEIVTLTEPPSRLAFANLDAGEAVDIEVALQLEISIVCIDELKGREKAAAIAGAIRQEIGKAVSIEEKDIQRWGDPNANTSSNSFSVSDDEVEPKTIAIGTISVKAQVEVQFLLN